MTSPLDPANLVPRLVDAAAAEQPDLPALVEVGVGTTTYGQLAARARRWADGLHAAGVVAGDRVATMLPPGVDAHALWLACAWLRALEVPIGTAYQGPLLRHQLADSGAVLAVTEGRFAERFVAARAEVPALGHVVVAGPPLHGPATPPIVLEADLLGRAAEGAAPHHDPEPWDLAAVLYTSGTTGPSKGVLVPWGQLASGIDAFDDVGPGDVLFAPFAPSHLAGKLPLQLTSYWRGTHVVRADGFKTDAFWDDVRTHGCNRAWLFHALVNFLWRQPPAPDDADNPLETVTGGPLLHEFREFGARFGVRMRTNFGMTEAGWPITTGDDVTDAASCGRPRPGYDLRIVDEHDLPVPVGEVGELIVRAHDPWVMNLGYLGRPDVTAEAWRNGWFHTGDAFRCDAEGRWYFVDRIKDAIRRRSENISSYEVEALVGEHPGVLEVAAVGVPSDDGEEEVLVCVVPKPGIVLDPAELVEAVAPSMPAYMVPRFVEVLEELPKTPTGKVRKVELREGRPGPRTWERAPVGARRR